MGRTGTPTPSGSVPLDRYLDTLRARAVANLGVCAETALRATDVTRRHLASEFDHGALSRRDRTRIRAYFGAVVRRQVISRSDPRDHEYRLRLRVATLADDLGRAGFGREAIRREAAEFFGAEALAFLPAAVA